MSQNAWWLSPLQKWATTLGVDVKIEQIERRTIRTRNVGAWWRDGDYLCVQLDEQHFARIPAANALVDTVAQNLLSWLLESFHHAQRSDWRAILQSWGEEAITVSEDELPRLWLEHRALDRGLEHHLAYPGHFVCLRIATSHGDHRDNTDILSMVEEVLRAYVHESFIGWIQHDHSGATALLYMCNQSEWGAFDIRSRRVPHTGIEAVEQVSVDAEIRSAVEELVQMIAADALTLAEAAIGQAVHSPDSLYRGILTAVMAWRHRVWIYKTDKVYSWGEQCIAHLLGSSPRVAKQIFMSAANVRSARADFQLSVELQEALHGVIMANLNVSEAARLLYLHRNTLLHRIERIRQQTGYDIRNFNDALTLWLVVSIDRYDHSRRSTRPDM